VSIVDVNINGQEILV